MNSILYMNAIGRIDRWGHFSDWSSVSIIEDDVRLFSTAAKKEGFEPLVVPVEFRLPAPEEHMNFHRIAIRADAEIKPLSFSVFNPPPGKACRVAGPSRKAVNQAWSSLSVDAREAINEIVLADRCDDHNLFVGRFTPEVTR